MNPSLLIGVDAGTSSCKATLIDAQGQVLASASQAYTTVYPKPGWAEQDPDAWYRALVHAVRHCVSAAGVSARDVSALSVCGPAHNVVLLDRDDRVLQPVILWSDARSAPQAGWLGSNHGSSIFNITYQAVNPGWSLSQLLWVRQNQPDIWRQIHRVVIGKDYLSYRLTGAWGTDPYDATGTQIHDVRAGQWSPLICDLLGLPPSKLPPIGAATSVTGNLTTTAARETGLTVGTVVAVGSGDSAVEALAAGAMVPGHCIIKLGTAGNVNVVTAEPRPHPRTLTYPHVIPGLWMTILATNAGAAAADWFAHAFDLRASTSPALDLLLLEQMAAAAPAGSEGLIFHPYLQGERSPYWDPNLRGGFIGITIRHRQEHFARAILEGVAFSLRDCLGLLRELGIPVSTMHLMGGGARGAVWPQIMADALAAELTVSEPGVTSIGAAMVAGVAAGLFKDVRETARIAPLSQKTVSPDAISQAQYERQFPLYQALTRNLRPIYHALSEFNS
jgi:xylulokinase